jgi:regulator of protease activity HflC (stomatin/prohibitin superfamily)
MFKFVENSTSCVIKRFGQVNRVKGPGLRFVIPFVEEAVIISNRTQQQKIDVRFLTKDRAFVEVNLSIQYRIEQENTVKAFTSFDDPIEQMTGYVENAIISKGPNNSLKDLYTSFNSISDDVLDGLREKMGSHGFTVDGILLTQLNPDAQIVDSINRVASSERAAEAAKNQAEADYTIAIRKAEADKARQILRGEGIAGQRDAIIKGYQGNIDKMVSLTGLKPDSILRFILESLALDVQKEIGASQNTKVIFVPSGLPQNGSSSIQTDIISGLETVLIDRNKAQDQTQAQTQTQTQTQAQAQDQASKNHRNETTHSSESWLKD